MLPPRCLPMAGASGATVLTVPLSAVVGWDKQKPASVFDPVSPCQYFEPPRALTTRGALLGAIWAIASPGRTTWLFRRSSFRMMPDSGAE